MSSTTPPNKVAHAFAITAWLIIIAVVLTGGIYLLCTVHVVINPGPSWTSRQRVTAVQDTTSYLNTLRAPTTSSLAQTEVTQALADVNRQVDVYSSDPDTLVPTYTSNLIMRAPHFATQLTDGATLHVCVWYVPATQLWTYRLSVCPAAEL